jgi:CBS domain-containing protein
MVVQQIMTLNPVTVDASDSLDWVEHLLAEHDVRHLPVLADGVLTGIISERDIAPFRSSDEGRAQVSAGQIMSSNLVTVSPETEVSEVVDTLLDQKIGALLVVDGASHSLVGIVSYIDVLRAVRDEV